MFNYKKISWLWPEILNIEEAKKASLQGVWACLFIAVITAILAAFAAAGYPVNGFSSDAFIDALFFLIIGFGIKKQSRTAAVSGLALYIIELIYNGLTSTNGVKNSIIAIIFVMAFITTVRGTFAYHKFIGSKVNIKNLIVKILIGLLLSIFLYIIIILMIVFVPAMMNLSDRILGLLLFSNIFISFTLSFNGWLPFTKNHRIVFVPENITIEY